MRFPIRPALPIMRGKQRVISMKLPQSQCKGRDVEDAIIAEAIIEEVDVAVVAMEGPSLQHLLLFTSLANLSLSWFREYIKCALSEHVPLLQTDRTHDLRGSETAHNHF